MTKQVKAAKLRKSKLKVSDPGEYSNPMLSTIDPKRLLLVGSYLVAALALVIECPANAETVNGPLYSEAELHAKNVHGVTLGMPLSEAISVLQRKGFTQRFRTSSRSIIQSTDGIGVRHISEFFLSKDEERADVVSLGYIKQGIGKPIVAEILFTEPKPLEEMRVGGDSRPSEIIKRYGQPSRWHKGIIDLIYYTSSDAFLDGGTRDLKTAICSNNWRCSSAKQRECSLTIDGAKATVLTIELSSESARYRWSDYPLIREALLKPSVGALDRESRGSCQIHEIMKNYRDH